MSYPYTLDLAFGSERASADTITHANIASDSPLPKTQEEIDALVQKGLAYACTIYPCGGALQNLPQAVEDSLPDNLKGIVCVMDNEVVSLYYEVYDGQVYVGNSALYYEYPIYVVLKQPVD